MVLDMMLGSERDAIGEGSTGVLDVTVVRLKGRDAGGGGGGDETGAEIGASVHSEVCDWNLAICSSFSMADGIRIEADRAE